MQGSVHTFDPQDGSGSVVLDTGKVLPFSAEVFASSGLRLLRVGQRLSLVASDDPEAEGTVITRLWIVGIGAGEVIA